MSDQIPLIDPEDVPDLGIRAADDAEKARIVGDDSFSIPFGTIVVGADNVRGEMDPDQLRGLAESIRRVGLLSPLTVETVGEVVMLAAGHRRWHALKALGFGERDPVPVHFKTPDLSDRLVAMVAENNDRLPLSPVDEAEACRRLYNQGLTQRAIAARLGWSPSTVSARLALFDLPGYVMDLVRAGEIDATAAGGLGRLYRDGHTKVAAELVRMRAPAVEIDEAAKRIKQAAALDRMVADLESRGFDVVLDDPPFGLVLYRNLGAYPKTLDPDALDTATAPDGSPYVGVTRGLGGELTIWSVADAARPQVEQSSGPAAPGFYLDRDAAFARLLESDNESTVRSWIRDQLDRVIDDDLPYLARLLDDKPGEIDRDTIAKEHTMLEVVTAIALIETAFYG